MYLSKIQAEDIEFDQSDGVTALQAVLDKYGFDHVRDKQGRTFKIGGQLAKKSVPLEPGDGPSRINFTSVVSFGIEAHGEPTAYAKAVEAGDTVEAEAAKEDAAALKAQIWRELHPWEEAGPGPEPEPQEENPDNENRAHAVLSASGANRWMNCPPSARIEAELPDSESPAAAEGTAAHALGEHKIRRLLKQRSTRPVSEYNDDDMEDYTDNYAAFVLDRYQKAQESDRTAVLALEQRLDFSHLVPDGFGTGDAVIIQEGVLEVIDFKYGAGVIVDAWENPQLKLYALGALAQYDLLFDVQEVRMTIYQPRRDNISTFTLEVEELTRWGEEEVKPRAELAAEGGGDFSAGDWCMFCKIKPTCKARAEAALEFAQWEFEDPTELSDAEIAQALRLIPLMRSWAADLEKYALTEAVDHGRQWEGMKVVAGRAVRKYTDPDEVAKRAQAAGYSDIFDRKLITLTKLEKLMGKKDFTEHIGDLVHKPEGKPTLVPVEDKRPELTPRDAGTEFADI